MKTALDLMMEFQKKYPTAGKDPLLYEICKAVEEEYCNSVKPFDEKTVEKQFGYQYAAIIELAKVILYLLKKQAA